MKRFLSYMNKFKVLALLLMVPYLGMGQSDKLVKAVKLVQNEKADSAKIFIDAASIFPATANNAYTWYVKGYVYNELYKKQQVNKSLREEALNSFKKSIALDSSSEYKKDNLDYIKIIAESFFNDAVSAMDSVNYKIANEYYGKYKENMKIFDPTLTFIQKDIEFNLALSTIYNQIYEAQKKPEFLASTIDIYNKILKDASSEDASIASSAYIWQVKGIIYKELYKKKEKQNKKSPFRLQAFYCFKKSIALDNNSEYLKDNLNSLKFLASKFFNDAMDTAKIDLSSYSQGTENFSKYCEAIKIVNPAINTTEDEIEFHNHMGLNYFNLFNANNEPNYSEMTIMAFTKVLSMDSNNYRANFNMGILYHNMGVEIINRSDYDIDIAKLDAIQEEAVVLLKKSLPFMKKAYQLNPNRKETIKGLQGIYYALNDYEKSNEFKAKMETLGEK